MNATAEIPEMGAKFSPVDDRKTTYTVVSLPFLKGDGVLMVTICRENSYDEDEIYNNDEDFFNTFFEGRTMEAVRAVSFGEYRYQDEYVKFNGYANLETFNSPENEIDVDAIAGDILENPASYDIELEETEEEETA